MKYDDMTKKQVIRFLLRSIIYDIIFASFFLFAWNDTLPYLFGFKTINYWQSFMISVVLIRLSSNHEEKPE